jgi:hypothetical protein
VVFFLPVGALTLPIGRQVLAWALFAFISVFALTNSLRMASIMAADQATARADRQTEGVSTADHALDVVRSGRDDACGRGLGKTPPCPDRPQPEMLTGPLTFPVMRRRKFGLSLRLVLCCDPLATGAWSVSQPDPVMRRSCSPCHQAFLVTTRVRTMAAGTQHTADSSDDVQGAEQNWAEQ